MHAVAYLCIASCLRWRRGFEGRRCTGMVHACCMPMWTTGMVTLMLGWSLPHSVDDLAGPLTVLAATSFAPLASASLLRPKDLDKIYVRPGVGKSGVGLICIRDVPKGSRICFCSAEFSQDAYAWTLSTLPAQTRRTINELFDGFDGTGRCLVPTNYDQCLPLVAFINHEGENPNCVYDVENNAIVSARRLRAGEEATIDYTR